MPLFFICSGVAYGMKSEEDISLHIWNKVKSLIVPYIFWCSLHQLVLYGLASIGKKSCLGIDDLWNHYLRNVAVLGSVMWFLPVMFVSVCIFLRLVHNKKILIASSIVALWLGLFVPANQNWISETILKACIGYAFIAAGYLGSHFFRKQCKWQILATLIPIHIWIAFSNGTVNLAGRFFGIRGFYLIESMLGTYIVFQLAMLLNHDKIAFRLIAQYGQFSVIVLCLHQLAIDFIRIADYKVGDLLPKLGIAEGFVLAAITLGLIKMSMPIVLRCFSWSFGITNKRRKRCSKR